MLTLWSLGLKPWQELPWDTSTATCYQVLSLSMPPSQMSAGVCICWEELSTVDFFYWAHSMATRATRRAEQAGRNRGPPGDLKSYALPTGTKFQDLPNGKLQLQRVGKGILMGQMEH